MKNLIFALFIVALTGCANKNLPTEFETGKEVKPPYGCIELRKERKDANC